MTGFFDIHTHILPGVDDGARDLETALALLEQAYENGTRAVLLTPHYRGKYRQNTPQQLKTRFEEFQQAVKEQLPDLQLYLGQELYYDTAAVEALAEERALGIHDTGYVLLEFSPKSTREKIQKGVDAVLYYGYRPVIAHGERYDALRKDKKLRSYVLSQGALLQINADSILGRYGWGVKRFCHQMLKTGAASFVASDAHDRSNRPPLLRDCFEYVCKKYGEEYARKVFWDNPVKLIENKDI